MGNVEAGGTDERVRPIRVAVLLESAYMRLGCAQVLERSGAFEIVATARPDEHAALKGVERDLVVVGIAAPRDPGAYAIQHLADGGDCVVAMLGPGVAPSVALSLGAHVCVHGIDPDGTELEDTLAALVRSEIPRPDTPRMRLATISPRERQILAEVARGATDQQIALTLGISARTVQSPLHRIREKTGCRRRGALTTLAFELGISGIEPEREPEQQ